MKQATIQDIAKICDVSVATVSLILNKPNHKRFSAATVAKVLEAAKTLNYQTAASRQPKSGVIGLMIQSITNPFYPALARGIEDAAQKVGYSVLLCTTYNNHEPEQKYIELLIQKNVDGIILTFHPSEAVTGLLIEHPQIKVVSLIRNTKLKGASFLTVDNIRGGYMAAKHLLDLGHRKIAYIGRNMERLTGFRQAFTENGFNHDPDLVLVDHNEINVVVGEDVIDLGFSLTQKILKDNPEITAIFAHNDLAALGAMAAASEMGYRIPEELSIIGYDDIPFASLARPALTTIEQPKYDRGQDAVEVLYKQITDSQSEPAQIVYRPRLIIRDSTGPVRGAARPG